jgi:serine/threonine-protein kinase
LARAAELDPQSAPARRYLGMTMRRLNDPRALGELRKATELDPLDWESALALATYHFEFDRLDEAAAGAATALRLAPDNPIVLRSLGGIYLAQNRLDEAAGALQRALEIEPTANIYLNLGTVNLQAGKPQEAVRANRKAIEMGANQHAIWGSLGEAYYLLPGEEERRDEAFETAIRMAERWLDGHPLDNACRSSIAVYFAKSGKKEEALRWVQEGLAQPKLLAGEYHRMGMAAEVAGDRALALRLVERALADGYPPQLVETDRSTVELRSDARF